MVLSNQESFGAGAGDSVPPHLASCEGVEHLVFEEEPQPLPLPLALLPTMEAAAHCGALHSKSNLIMDETNTHAETHTRLNVSPCNTHATRSRILNSCFIFHTSVCYS